MFGRGGNLIKPAQRRRILERDGHRCRKCNRDNTLDAHHIIARAAGGTDDDENLATLCRACHLEWHAVEATYHLTFEEWLPLPTYGVLVTTYLSGPAAHRAIVDAAWALRREHPPEAGPRQRRR